MNAFQKWLKETCEKYGTYHAFCYKQEAEYVLVSFQKLYEDVMKKAGDIGEEKEDIYVIYAKNSYEGIVEILAALIYEKTVLLANERLSKEEIESYFTEAFRQDVLEKNAKLLLFTSGTTGRSHAVMFSEEQVVLMAMNGRIFELDMQVKKQMKIMNVLPLYHMYSLNLVLSHLTLGHVMLIGTDLRFLMREIAEFQPEVMEVVPAILEMIANKVQRTIHRNSEKAKEIYVPKQMICGGAKLYKQYIDFYEQIGVEVFQGYGLTESGTIVSSCNQEMQKRESVGRANPYTKIEIIDHEICLQSSSLMLGYAGEHEETAKILVDGWLHTGDLGYIDEDGFLFITGRKKNLIILSNGENVSPEAIEEKLLENSLVTEVLVYEGEKGIEAEIYSEAGRIELESSVEKKASTCVEVPEVKKELQEIIDTYNRKVSREHQIAAWTLRKEPFEKTATNKIKRTGAH